MAQTVYSVNSVGFINLDLPDGFSLIANQLNGDGMDNTIGNIIPTVPDGTTIQKWDPGTQSFAESAQYYDGAGWLDENFEASPLALNPGEGAFIFLPSSYVITLVGEVPQGTLNVDLAPQFTVASQPTPQALSIGDVDNAIPAVDGDTIQFWDDVSDSFATSYQYYDGAGWLDENFEAVEPTPAVGEAFFYNRNGEAVTWTREFTVN
jgi:hypothetical protein